MRHVSGLVVVALLAACSTAGSGDTSVAPDAPESRVQTTTTVAEAPATTAATPTTFEPTTTTTTGVADIEAPDGWTIHSGPDAAIAAPEGWIDGKAFLEDPAAVDGKLESILESIGKDALELVDVLLIDQASLESGPVTQLNVIVAAVPPITDLVTVEQAIRVQIASFGGELVGTSLEDIAGTETLIIDYTVASDQGEITAQQYHQLHDDQLVTVTFAGTEREPGSWREIVATVTRT